ncbi:MAG: LysM domain-containing protein, partial [Pseudomonadota bacterium]
MQHSLHRRVVVPGPQAAGLAATRAAVLVAVLSAPIIAPLAQAADSEAGDCSFAVTVAEGDTLSLIAERFLGDVLAYRRLHDLNRAVVGPDPAILEVGTVLDVPCPPGGLETAVPAGPGDTARAVAAPGPVDAPAPGATGDAPAGGGDLSGDGAAEDGEAVPGQDATAPDGVLPTDAAAVDAAAVDTTAVDAAAVDAAPVDGTTLPIAVRGPLPGATGFVEEAALARRLSSGTRPQLIDLRAGDEASMTFLPGAVRVPDGWSGAAAATETGRAAAAALLARH